MMRKTMGPLVEEMGLRLAKVRKQLDYSSGDLAGRLGIKTTSYRKNENGNTLPGLITLQRLQQEFDVSMDWLLFNHGPMFLKDKQSNWEDAKKILVFAEQTGEIKELLEYMAQDPVLRHEILLHFYRYKNKKPDQVVQDLEPTDPSPS